MIGVDNNGNAPKEGDFVAYNMSGQIATGHVKRITRTFITITCSAPEWNRGKTSRIRGGAQCLLVLSPSQPEVRRRNLDALRDRTGEC